MNPDELARACADRMWAGDQASQGLGMVLDRVGPGAATLSMTVTARMLNGHGICHGGFIFALADSAFAFACNAGNAATVAAQCQVSFLRPVQIGARLVARAEERQREGRAGIYDVRVMSGAEIVAEFRGHCRTTGATVLDA